jgi:hypothetical protein
MSGASPNVVVRLTDEDRERIEQIRRRLQVTSPYRRVTASDVIRHALQTSAAAIDPNTPTTIVGGDDHAPGRRR